MADRHAIEDLFARYAEGSDKRDVGIVETTMTPGMTLTCTITGADTYGPFEGRDAVLEFMGGAFAAQNDRRRHAITNLTVLEDGEDRARVNAYLVLIVTDNGRTEVKSSGIYETEVVLHEGRWLLDSIVLTLDNGF